MVLYILLFHKFNIIIIFLQHSLSSFSKKNIFKNWSDAPSTLSGRNQGETETSSDSSKVGEMCYTLRFRLKRVENTWNVALYTFP